MFTLHWTASWVGVLASGIAFYLGRSWLVDQFKKFGPSDILLTLGEALFAFAAGGFVEHSHLQKRESWDNTAHSEHTLIVLALAAEFGLLALVAKWLLDKVKERDREKVIELSAELAEATKALANWRRLVSLIRGLVESKIERVSRALNAAPGASHLPSLVERQTQVQTILQLIHRFFLFDLEQRSPGKHQMRLGLYLPDSSHSKLELFYSWDGTTQDCFGTIAPEAMMLTSPQGIFSEISRAYHLAGTRRLIIIPDCAAAAAAGDFRFFTTLQNEHLKSMLAYKYVFKHLGTEDALVLAIDCNATGFFTKDRAEEIIEFLDEMLVRFEYELVGLEAADRQKPSN